MLLHAKHASAEYSKVLISSPDTDVFIICLAAHINIEARLYFLTGIKNARRIIDVTKVADNIFETIKECDVQKEVVMKSLIGFHSFTGCDTISLFAGRGKVKPLKVLLCDIKYIQTFAQPGESTELDPADLQIIQSFVCHMYGYKGTDSVDEVRYKIYFRKIKK